MRRLLLLILLSAATADGKQDADNSAQERILKLNGGNFDRALREHKQLLVHFCKRLAVWSAVTGTGWAGDVLIFHCVQILLWRSLTTGWRRRLTAPCQSSRGRRWRWQWWTCLRRRSWPRSSVLQATPPSGCTWMGTETALRFVLVRAGVRRQVESVGWSIS